MTYPRESDALIAYGQGPRGPAGDASQAAIDAAIAALKNGVSAAHDTLKEIEDDLALKAPLASPALTGNPTAPTQANGDNSTKLANTAFVQQELTNYAQPIDPLLTSLSNLSTSISGVLLYTAGVASVLTFDTDGTLAGNSDTRVASQKAVKAYVDTLAAIVSGALVFKGAWDASAGTFPGGGTAKVGYFYKVSVAGTVGGVAFTVGDDIYAVVDNASTSTYANNWLKIEGSITAAEVAAALGYTPAGLASPAFTGVPTVPTAAVDTNTTQAASTAFMIAQAASATPLMDGAAAVGISTRFARGDHVHPTDTSLAPKASPALTGVPTAPTAAVDTSTTQLATAAFVIAQAASATPLMNGAAAVGISTRFARGDHVHPVDTSRAAAGANADITSLTALASINGGQLAGFRNLLINPDGRINQRLPAAAASTNNTYGHDRWIALTQTAGITVSTLTDAENGTPRMWRLSQANAAAQRMGYCHWIEGANCKHLRGKNITLSGRVRSSTTATVRYALCEWTGTEDTPGAARDIVNNWASGTYTAGNFFKSTTFNVLSTGSIALTANTLADLTALTAAVGAGANNLIAFIWTDTTVAQNVTLDGHLQLEQGSVATAREFRPSKTERDLCLWYYQKSYPLATAPASTHAAGSGSLNFSCVTASFGQTLPTAGKMRIAPTLTVYDSAGTAAKVDFYNGAWNAAGAVSASSTTDGYFFVQNNTAATTNVSFDVTLDAEI